MTNYEKYKDQIDWQARAGAKLAVRKSDNTPIMCEEIYCSECKFYQAETKCGLQAIEWLKAECVESKKEIEVGDMVEIIDNGCSYTTYSSWVVNHVLNKYDMLRYDIGQKLRNGVIGIVKGKGLHCSNGKMLYYIEINTGRCYLISEDGIKLSGGKIKIESEVEND